MVALLHSNPFRSASDGSVKFLTHGSFGWSVSLPNGRRLATCSGPVYGAKPSSYRAEGYGMLSLLRFFIRLFEYCDTPHDTAGVIVCDNLLLINKVIAYQSPFPTAALLDEDWTPFDSLPTLLSNTSPSATLAPDWDVLNEIHHSLHDLNFRPTFQHIKGHQDRDTPYDNLPLLAQLNVDADTAAGHFQSQHGCHHPHVPLLPHAGANDNVSRWKSNRTEKCPSCPHPREDRDHVLRCPHPACAEWRQKFLISLRKTCDKLHTRPHLQMILLSAMEAWLNDNPPDFSTYPSVYSNLIYQQTQIGWRQLFNGRISTKWSRLQDEYLQQQGQHNKKTTGQLWATNILSSIWEEWHLVWTIRNAVIHGHDQTSRNRIQQIEAEVEIRAIYNNRELLLPADQDHLFDDVDFHLSFSTNSLCNWLNTYQGMFMDSISKAKRRATDGV
jgi:hypothetical protein